MRGGISRRRFLAGTAGLATVRPLASAAPVAAATTAAAGGPDRQHQWTETLHRDADGNPLPPRYQRLLLLDVRGRPSGSHARRLEAALRALEQRFPWGPQGLLFTVGWGHSYFTRRIGREPPVPRAVALSELERPHIDAYDVCLHLACDDPARLAVVEAALRGRAELPGPGGSVRIDGVLAWRETRTGFVGAGLPAAHRHVHGIPAGAHVPAATPLFMGFVSSRAGNQASEEAITIGAGPFAGGTTMHVSQMELDLERWYGAMSKAERVARMYAPQVTPAEAARFTTDAASDPGGFDQAAERYGMVGHAQAAARARVGGQPLILRRDFNTVDGGHAGVHFVSLQRTIEDFVATRRAMNASRAHRRNRAITATARNGINEFMHVRRRGNYIVPPRHERAFPLVRR